MNHEEWGEGPWNWEEDHAVWVDEPTDLDCMIHRNGVGALCGYVGVPPSHPLHGMVYDHVDHLVEAHGGLTYANSCEGPPCHVPAEGREHDIWWFGFDCAHFQDVAPGMEADLRKLREKYPEHALPWLPLAFDDDPFPKMYRNWHYVLAEVTSLAVQLKALA